MNADDGFVAARIVVGTLLLYGLLRLILWGLG